MFKSSATLAFLTLTTLAGTQQHRQPIVPLGEGRMTIEHVAGGEAVVRIEAESEEQLEHVRIQKPGGESFLELSAGSGSQRGLSGLVLELSETDLANLLASYEEGDYAIQATTRSGKLALGHARLSFDMPPAPRIVYPPSGASAVSTSGLTVLWLADRNVAGYHVQLEQGENDGLAVSLPPGKNSFRVPDGFLARGAEMHLEVTSVAANGNQTVAEAFFTTEP